MKNKKQNVPAPSKLNLLRQICNFIPDFLVPKLARETGVQEKARTFSPWSHVVALQYAQLTHSIGLNDVCDALGLHSGPLSSLRGATPPSRNNLSHANKVRPAEMAEKLFWAVFEHLGDLSPGFVSGKAGKRFARRFKRTIHVVDSTTIQLVASCMDWAKHRRRKAAAKCHLRLDLQSFLPRFAIVDTAREADAKRAREVCAGIKPGEIVIFDKAYMAFEHLAELSMRMVFWVTRAKDNLSFKVVRRCQKGAEGKIVRDDLIRLKNPGSRKEYPELLRRIVAQVEVDGKEMQMAFLSNNLEWSAESIVELYRCRWQIEVFFKQIKQTLQLADFLGTSANAVRWQVWTALLTYLLLRYVSFLSKWSHSFSRLFTLIRTCLIQLVQKRGQFVRKQLVRLPQPAALAEWRVIEIVWLDAQAGADVVADEIEPGELVRREDRAGFGLVHEPFVEAFGHGIGERFEHGLLFQREADESDKVGKASGLRAVFDLAAIGRTEGVPEIVLGQRGVVVAQFLFQFLEHRLGEALFVRAAVKDLQGGDFGFVLLEVFAEAFQNVRGFFPRGGIEAPAGRCPL